MRSSIRVQFLMNLRTCVLTFWSLQPAVLSQTLSYLGTVQPIEDTPLDPEPWSQPFAPEPPQDSEGAPAAQRRMEADDLLEAESPQPVFVQGVGADEAGSGSEAAGDEETRRRHFLERADAGEADAGAAQTEAADTAASSYVDESELSTPRHGAEATSFGDADITPASTGERSSPVESSAGTPSRRLPDHLSDQYDDANATSGITRRLLDLTLAQDWIVVTEKFMLDDELGHSGYHAAVAAGPSPLRQHPELSKPQNRWTSQLYDCNWVASFIRPATMLAGYLGRLGPQGRHGRQEDVPGTLALFRAPHAVVLDDVKQVLYVSDAGNHVVRIIELSTQLIRTVAGVFETPGTQGDGGPARRALLSVPNGMALHHSEGQLYIADEGNHAIRSVDLEAGRIHTIAGVLGREGSQPFPDGSPATQQRLKSPAGLALDSIQGLLYISDSGNSAIRVLDLPAGRLSTLPANGIRSPLGLAIDVEAGQLYVADRERHVVWVVDAPSSEGNASVVAGTLDEPGMVGTPIYENEADLAERYFLPADQQKIYKPNGLTLDAQWKKLYITDEAAPAIRQLDIPTGQLSRSLAFGGRYGRHFGGAFGIGPIGIAIERTTIPGFRVEYNEHVHQGYSDFGRYFYFNTSTAHYPGEGVYAVSQYRDGVLIWRGHIEFYDGIYKIGPVPSMQFNCPACNAQGWRWPFYTEARRDQFHIGDVLHLAEYHPEVRQRIFFAEANSYTVRVADLADPPATYCPGRGADQPIPWAPKGFY
eukprot:TRINITY_DN42029_c0_g1_i1.p1 TRINITY_DN42029_c0_g1~~TRINITY_DN42029_c0_g1_i1.p1  ORF type:complete len:761 (-),score=81.65 TRINITY_DN42029_c0_g1_i1:311-2593(-)